MNVHADEDLLEKELLGDVFLALSDEPHTPERARSAIRAIFAAVEGVLFAMKQRLADAASDELSAGELSFLREEGYSLRNDGQVETRPLPIRFKSNVRFAIAIIRKLHPDTSATLDNTGWKRLSTTLDVRHRLTHPKTVADLTVTPEELDAALEGFLWFLSLTAHGEKALIAALSTPGARQRRLAKALREWTPGTAS